MNLCIIWNKIILHIFNIKRIIRIYLWRTTNPNKAQIVESISNEVNLTKKDVAYIIDSLFDIIKKGLVKDSHIELRGFGTFGTKVRKARMARNPKTNEPIKVPEHSIAYFKPGKELKDLVTSRKG